MIRRLVDTNLRRALWVALTPVRVGAPIVGPLVMPFGYPFAGGDDE
ncbi:hypothetical protein SEA_SUERTE_56 [Gordonia phage Suerte]|uniref:Uncharacterized protein n=1 Tax=Gordonia phage Suerte TaxID=2652883 RepID=A0A5P8DDG5_9CAUD|nr:hypothetical protein PP511_gp56 [Gordonia phage Suerte]QFP97027.1 hypothetical protein SEA_SUERTE_56 [Gordonia phage Suerte]